MLFLFFAAQQMPRHAGFAMVASATQNLANAFLNAFAATVPLEPINLPNIVIGGNTVSIQGTLALLPPQVAFHDRTDNLVTTQLAVGGLLVLTTSSHPTQFVDVILSASADLPLSTSVQGNNIISAVDLSHVVLTSVSIQYLAAPPSPLFQNAVARRQVLSLMGDNRNS